MTVNFGDFFSGSPSTPTDILPKTAYDAKEQTTPIYTDEAVKKIIDDAQQTEQPNFNCLVVGTDDTGKTGIVMDYCSKLDKKSLFVDVDGGCLPLKQKFYKDNDKIHIVNPLVVTVTQGDILIDYYSTITRVKALVKYVRDHSEEFSALVIDGISTLLKYCEFVMRIEKNLTVEGEVQLKYWVAREKIFREIIELTKSCAVNKFYIGHNDFIPVAGVKYIHTKGGETIELTKTPAVIMKMNQSVFQRIICTKVPDGTSVSFVAKIDKSKYNINKEGQVVTFAMVTDNSLKSWSTDKVWEGLI